MKKEDVVILEEPNHLFRHGGASNLDKYRTLPNGSLKSITKAVSDYKAVYEKIDLERGELNKSVSD